MRYNQCMTQWWMVEQLAEQHRQDLTREFRSHSKKPRRQEMKATASLEVVQAGTGAKESARPERPPVGHHLGNWLIRAGTRLGGASIRTSS